MLAGSPVMNIYQSFKKNLSSILWLSDPLGSGVGGKESSRPQTRAKDYGPK